VEDGRDKKEEEEKGRKRMGTGEVGGR